MLTDTIRLIDQCRILCGIKLFHMKIFSDGESMYGYELSTLHGTTWIVIGGSPALERTTLESTRAKVECLTRTSCRIQELIFRWERPARSSPDLG